MTTSVFANRASTTVMSGGTTAPAAGTPETWVVTSSVTFPSITQGVTQFAVADQAARTELVNVVAGPPSGTWSVIRGAENTTPVAHQPGFAIYNPVTAGALNALLQQGGSPSFADLSATQVRSGPGSLPAGVTGTPALIAAAPASASDDIFVIADSASVPRSGSAQLWAVYDHTGSLIFSLPPSGGPRAIGTYSGCWLNGTVPAVQMTPYGGLQFSPGTTPSSGGPAWYGAPGAPPSATITSWMQAWTASSGTLVTANVGDLYIQQDAASPQALWICTTAGTSMSPGGTWSPAVPRGLLYLTGGGTIATTNITAAVSAGYQGLYLDPRFVWNISGPLVIDGTTNFIIASDMVGSIGYNGAISYNNTGYVYTGTSADGLQIYATTSTTTQGIILQGLAIVGANPNAVVHFGGGQRQCGMRRCFIYNTATASTTVASGSNSGNIANIASWSSPSAGVLDVASVASLPSAGQAFVQTTQGGQPGLALIAYTSTTGGGTPSLNGCTFVAGAGTVNTGNIVAPPQAGVVLDTVLSNSSGTYLNSEDQFFDHAQIASASAGIALGIDLNSPSQHANDTSYVKLTTASGGSLASIFAKGGGGHNLWEFYDRSASGSAPLATVANYGATLVFTGGEDQNNLATGVAHLLNGASAKTVAQSRNLSVGNNSGPVATVTAGLLESRGMCRWTGTLNLAGGIVDLSDISGAFGTGTPGALAITGSSGTLVTAANYASGSPPNVSSWSGPVVTGHGSGAYLCTPVQYAPGGGSVTALTVSGTVPTAISSSNISTGSFTCPPSGAVVVTASFMALAGTTTALPVVGLVNHGTTTVMGYTDTWQYSSVGFSQRVTLPFLLGTLTPGASYNFDLAGASGWTSGTTSTWSILASGTTAPVITGNSNAARGGPVTMTVQAV